MKTEFYLIPSDDLARLLINKPGNLIERILNIDLTKEVWCEKCYNDIKKKG